MGIVKRFYPTYEDYKKEVCRRACMILDRPQGSFLITRELHYYYQDEVEVAQAARWVADTTEDDKKYYGF